MLHKKVNQDFATYNFLSKNLRSSLENYTGNNTRQHDTTRVRHNTTRDNIRQHEHSTTQHETPRVQHSINFYLFFYIAAEHSEPGMLKLKLC